MAAIVDPKNLFVREFTQKNDTVLVINQCEVGDVGCVVWDAALVLSSYLETKDFQDNSGQTSLLSGKHVIELGAGTGIVGLQAGCLGANCIVTDLPEFIPLLNLNIKSNEKLISGQMTARSLVWGDSLQHFPDVPDYLLLADCIYYAESLEPLVKTINDLSDKQTRVLCCYEERTSDIKVEIERRFFEMIRSTFDVSEISLERQDSHFRSPDIHIMEFKKR